MITYIVEDQILLPNDAFGQHYSGSEMFDDLADMDEVMQEAKKYYGTILMPFGQLVVRALDKLKGLPIKMIGPSHGIIWRSNPSRILEAYAGWGRGDVKRKAVIAYDTMWGSTEKMAVALADGIASRDVDVKLFDLKANQVAYVITELLEAKALLVGSSTINNGMLVPPAGFLHLLKGLKPKNKIGMAFGSFGWGGGAVKAIESELQAAGIELIEPGLSMQFVPDEAALANCVALGKKIGDRI
jgi:flavorubredoxin